MSLSSIFTLVGFAVGGPFGALIGGILGDILFPPEDVEGPRLNELNVQRSTVGAPIPIVYGTAALAGNVIWSGGLIETRHSDEVGGFLGIGGQEVNSYTYSVDVAIGICEGPISGIRRIWCDADLVYDSSDDETLTERLELGGVSPGDIADFLNQVRAASAQLDFELYLGDEDQLPDPTIQSYENVGYAVNVVPGFRGLAYIVFNNFQLANYGNRIPNFRFEVFTEGAETACGTYSTGRLLPWLEDARDPRSDDGVYTYYGDAGSGYTTPQTTLGAALDDLSAAFSGRVFTDTPYGWTTITTGGPAAHCRGTSTNDRVRLYMKFNSCDIGTMHCEQLPGAAPFATAFKNYFGEGNTVWWDGDWPAGGEEGSGLWVHVEAGHVPSEYFCGEAFSNSLNPVYRLSDQEIGVVRVVQPPEPCNLGVCVEWLPVTGTFKSLQAYGTDGTYVTSYPVNPTLASTDPDYSNQAFWEAAYADALAAGEPGIESGWTYGVEYPDTTSTAYIADCTTVEVDCVPMAQIVTDICRRAGLRTDTATQIDVSDLTTCVNGYIIGRQMSARDALEPLRLFGLWDAVESDAILRFVERGHALVASLTDDDLGAHDNGSEPPSKVVTSRVQEKDLPRRVRLHFANFEHDHEPSEQAASRVTTEAIEELDVEIAISMTPDTAAQLADIHLYAAWVGRNSYACVVDNNWLALEPTDCIEIPVDGQTERVRIVSVDYSIGGLVKIQAIRDDDGAYVSTAVANPGTPSGGVPGGAGSGPVCPTGMVILDIPRQNPSHVDAGYYVALYGECDSWACAEVQRSNDGGLTYGRVARTDLETTVGEIVTITGPATDPTLPGDSPAYDDTTFITVQLFEGTLSSITDEQIAAGQNKAAIGVDGAWVIVQFKTATLDTTDQWTLTDLIWGLDDTEHLLGTTGVGDWFVLLSDSGLLRIPETADNIGVEKQLKAVTCGQSLDDATVVNFTTWGLSYQRLCPSRVISATTLDPPGSPADGDSYLLPNDTSLSGVWANHSGEIATWSDETDSWVYCTPAPGTIIHVGEDDTSDPGDDVIAGGDGTTTPAPWTPAIPPLAEIDTSSDLDTSYFVVYTPEGYRKVLGTGVSGGGGGGADSNATYLTLEDESASLPNSLRLIEGDGIVFDVDTGNTLSIRRLESGIPGSESFLFVTETEITGGAVTSVTISGLDLSAHERYYLAFEVANATGSTMTLSLYFNGDTTAANYHAVRVGAAAGSIGTTTTATANFSGNIAATTGLVEGYAWIRRGTDGFPRSSVWCNTSQTAATNNGLQLTHVSWDQNTNVTSLTIQSSVASSLANGGKLKLWRIPS
jgi:Putative phage tail protein/Protein of unknown function (DUF2793)